MKRLIITVLLIGCGIFTAEAQKVYTDGKMFVIECVGMPADCYTKTRKPRTTDATATTLGSNAEVNLSSAANNKKVAYKFEVAATDNAAASKWLDAVNLCAGLSGGNWRLPTQRELQLILIESEKLKSFAGFTPFSAVSYWCATERTASDSWFVRFANDNSGSIVSSAGKASADNYVRCVRDYN